MVVIGSPIILNYVSKVQLTCFRLIRSYHEFYDCF